MRVCVFGLWHLGCVTAACLAHGGHEVIGIDPDEGTVERLRRGLPPLFEPGLEEMIREGLTSGRLRFESGLDAAMGNDVAWVTFDTPVDENDEPQPSVVIGQVESLLPHLAERTLVLVSSQLPVGTTRSLAVGSAARGGGITFGYSPENLRLGRAIQVFTKPDRVVVGLETVADREKVTALLAPFTGNIVWMGLEAAEMTKHAINAFLATSVAFMNEIASICEDVGADAKEVERGLKSEERIGARAYLSPGGAFAGGTLARDIAILAGLDPSLVLIPAVRKSNRQHRSWELRKLKERYQDLSGHRIAVLGLTYKPGTDTLRRSSAVELALALHDEGADVGAFDPAVAELPTEFAGQFRLSRSVEEVLTDADAVVIATPWPQFRELAWERLLPLMRTAVVIDPNWFVAEALREHTDVSYAAVGLPWRQS